MCQYGKSEIPSISLYLLSAFNSAALDIAISAVFST